MALGVIRAETRPLGSVPKAEFTLRSGQVSVFILQSRELQIAKTGFPESSRKDWFSSFNSKEPQARLNGLLSLPISLVFSKGILAPIKYKVKLRSGYLEFILRPSE